MTKLSLTYSFLAAAVVFDFVSAANLRQYDADRFLTITETSESGSTDFLTEVEGSVDDSSFLGSSEDSSERGFVLVEGEVESSVDGSTVHSLDTSEDSDDKSSDAVDDDLEDSGDDSESEVTSPYQPGTVKPAPIEDSTGGSHKFDKSTLTWWK